MSFLDFFRTPTRPATATSDYRLPLDPAICGPFSPPKQSRQAALDSHALKWSTCTACSLHECRSQVVIGSGRLPATLFVLGKAPNLEADCSGEPFAGPQASIFSQIVPPSTKTFYAYLSACGPSPEINSSQQETCWPRVLELLTLVRPKIVVCAGKEVDSFYIKHMQDVVAQLGYRPICIRINHPDYILQQADQSLEIAKACLVLHPLLEKLC